MLSQATQRANYNKDGTPQAPGTAVTREIASDEYEWYFQDAWQVRPNLTVTAGVRYSLYSPPYETNGLQVAPTVSMGQWFDQRVENMKAGIPSSASEIVTFDLAGPKNGKPGFYAWDKNNFAPRIAVAWTPKERLVVRGGYSKVFDRVGVGLATNFDEGFAFGMSTQISSPFGAAYETNPAARFVNTTTMPSTMPAAPAGGFPQTPPQRAGIITQSIDDTLVTPSAHMTSAIVGFDISRNYTVEVGYVGRFGRDMLIRRDLAMPLNLTDPASRTDYFTAAQTIIRAAQAAGHQRQFGGGRVRGPAGGGVLGEHFPRRGGRRPDGHAGDHARLHAERAGLDHRAVRHGHRVLAGVQQVRPVRATSPNSTIRSRRSAPSAARTTTA